MGNPEKKLRFVHIAGINGKGSTAAMTASILRKAGYRTGLYTSPYIYRFHERIQVDGMESEQLRPGLGKVLAKKVLARETDGALRAYSDLLNI